MERAARRAYSWTERTFSLAKSVGEMSSMRLMRNIAEAAVLRCGGADGEFARNLIERRKQPQAPKCTLKRDAGSVSGTP